MADALTVPSAVAALVLCIAGLAKLRSPAPAARAVARAPGQVRTFAVGEVALAAWVLVAGGAVVCGLMAAVYAGFAGLALVLARRGAACGCFGSERSPASPIQSALSGALALVAGLAAAAGAHGAAWILQQSPVTAAVVALGAVAASYAVVLAYAELPLLWRSWSPA